MKVVQIKHEQNYKTSIQKKKNSASVIEWTELCKTNHRCWFNSKKI